MYSIVAPLFKSFTDEGLYYEIPDPIFNDVKIGSIVYVNYINKKHLALVLDITDNPGSINKNKIKQIESIANNNIILNQKYIKIILYITNFYLCKIHHASLLYYPKNLLEKIQKDKLVIKENLYEYSFNYSNKLSIEQNNTYKKISNSNANKFLIHGVTGSGKTEIYINLIKKYINQDKQVLLLIPEIILANQITNKLIQIFGKDIILINSSVTQAKKTKYYLDINNNNAKIIIGTRSALFYPYNQLGLIIIDEEHDNSYISNSDPRYNAIDIANKITDLGNNKLVLGTGTPSVKTMYDAINNKYKLINIFNNYRKQ